MGSVGKAVAGEFGPEIEAVRLVTRLFLEEKSYNDIVDALNASPWRSRRADRRTFAGVRKILLNDFYAGYVTYRDLANDAPSDKFPALWNPDTHQAIIRERLALTPAGGTMTTAPTESRRSLSTRERRARADS
jgi:hypothetical protein